MGIFYREKAFYTGKTFRKNDFTPSEKYSSYAPGINRDADQCIEFDGNSCADFAFGDLDKNLTRFK